MKVTALLSAFLHLAIVLFAWLGLPSARPMPTPATLIEVDVVSEEMLKALMSKKKPPPRKIAATPPERAKSEPPKTELPKPAPSKPTPPKPVLEKAVPIPDLKPVAQKKPTPPEKVRPRPKAKPKSKPRKVTQKTLPKKSPKAKPKAPAKNDFASVLKTVSKLQTQPRIKTPEPKKKSDTQKTFLAALNKKLQRRTTSRSPRIGAVLSNSEMEAVQRQIEPCWSVRAGARGAENMVVEIRAVLTPDGRVQTAKITDTARMARDPFYRSMAESARRAILDHRCQPLRLPLDKYDEWHVMILNFDPRSMF